jgi:nickel superoxide dismutase
LKNTRITRNTSYMNLNFRLLTLILTLFTLQYAWSHCQVPCGVYGDSARFTQMLEDQTTIAKAIDQISELAGKKDAKSANQLNRWVAAKEDHASKVQKIIAEYFLTQRIKSSSEKYGSLLEGAHSVMVAAMKCKQGTDTKSAETLKSAIKSFQQVYEK